MFFLTIILWAACVLAASGGAPGWLIFFLLVAALWTSAEVALKP